MKRTAFARRAVLACLMSGTLVVAGCGLSLPGRDGRPSAETSADTTWRACPEVAEEVAGRSLHGIRYDCATITVPQDWTAAAAARPGQTFEIQLIRARSERQKERIGSLVVSPGATGPSGIDLAVLLSGGSAFGGLSEAITRRFDVVGFDPRGVVSSNPLFCFSSDMTEVVYGSDPDPKARADFDVAVEVRATAAKSCGLEFGKQLRRYATVQSTRDLEAIRQAVGDETLTFLGYSHGTVLGATYAQLYPDKIRAMVLDGALNPRSDRVEVLEDQAQAHEQAFTRFVRWCEDRPSTCPIATDPRAAVFDAMSTARTSPVRGANGRAASAGWVFHAVLSALLNSTWQELAVAVDELADGNPARIFGLADAYVHRDATGQYDNLRDTWIAVTCADSTVQPSVAEIRRLQSRWRKRYPLFGAPMAINLLDCEGWPAEPDPYPTGPAAGAPPIVAIATTGDPFAPPEHARGLTEMLTVGRVLSVDGEGHTAYPRTHCVTEAVNAYLIDLVMPTVRHCSAG